MKAWALFETGLVDDAVALLERFLREYPDEIDTPFVQERLGDIFRQQGRLDEAVRRYRLVLQVRPLLMSSGMTAVSLAEVLLDQGSTDAAADALALAKEDSVTAFHANLFRYLAVRARVSLARGDTSGAAADAEQALGLVHAPDQYSRHPGIGAVDPDDPTIPLLRSLLPTG